MTLLEGRPLLGVLGGMGPAATADFMQKVMANTRANCDQDHIPMLVASIPQIPDRTEGWSGRGPSPLPALLQCGKLLKRAGSSMIVMPCNTAHLWFEDLRARLGVTMLHIADAAIRSAVPQADVPTRVGLLATESTIRSGLYPARARSHHSERLLRWGVPDPRRQDGLVTRAIDDIKAGELQRAGALLAAAASVLVRGGAEVIVMGCTEIPLALKPEMAGVRLVDAPDALACEAVKCMQGTPNFLPLHSP